MKLDSHVDVAVIGSGSAGVAVARVAASKGLSVAVVERDRTPGGNDIRRTIPRQILSQIASNPISADDRIRSGMELAPLFRPQTALEHARHSEETLRSLAAAGAHLFHGRARIVEPGSLSVLSPERKESTVHARAIVVACGSRPRPFPNVEIDHENILDTDSLLDVVYIPKSLTVLAHPDATLEDATLFAKLGTRVSVIFDENANPVTGQNRNQPQPIADNIQFLGWRQIHAVGLDNHSRVVVRTSTGETIRSEKLLVEYGRCANDDRLGLEKLSIRKSEAGLIEIDSHFATSCQGILAVGSAAVFSEDETLSHEEQAACLIDALLPVSG